MNRTQAFQTLKRAQKRLKKGDKKALQEYNRAMKVVMVTEGEQG